MTSMCDIARYLGTRPASYAVSCLHADHPDRILWRSCDLTGEIAYLEDGDVAELNRDGLRVLDHWGQSVERPRTHINWR